jgi:hypothetical protein
MHLTQDTHHRRWKYYHPIPAEQAGPHKDTHIKVEVIYVMGGRSWASGAMNPRGYRVDLTRVARNGGMESYVLLGNDSGVYVMLEQVKSFQQKKLDAWATTMDPVVGELAEAFLKKETTRVIAIVGEKGGKMYGPPLEAPPEPVKELITQKLRDELREAGHCGQKAICKFFNPCGAATWIISGMDTDNDTLWCLADLGLDCCEQGTVSLKELQETKLAIAGMHIERDIHFDPKGRTLEDFQKIYDEKGTLAGVS